MADRQLDILIRFRIFLLVVHTWSEELLKKIVCKKMNEALIMENYTS